MLYIVNVFIFKECYKTFKLKINQSTIYIKLKINNKHLFTKWVIKHLKMHILHFIIFHFVFLSIHQCTVYLSVVEVQQNDHNIPNVKLNGHLAWFLATLLAYGSISLIYCYLFTDLSNSSANSVCERIMIRAGTIREMNFSSTLFHMN